MKVIRWAVVSVVFIVAAVAATRTIQADGQELPDTWKIQCVGNVYFDTDSIRTGLALDRAVQLARVDPFLSDQYLDLVRRRIIRGYQNSGFRDVQVTTAANSETGAITATIDEGQQWKTKDVVVTGLSERESEYVVSLLKDSSDKSNPLQKSQPKLQYWKRDSEISFVNGAETLYRKTAHEALTGIGYPQAEFTVEFPASTEGEKHTVDLSITVIATGTALTVGDFVFTGLEKHSTEHLMQLLNLKTGMPLTLLMREAIVSKLLDSGRFLAAEVTHEPFFFDSAEPLDVTIRVHEYDLIAPLGQEITEVQQTLVKTSDWLSKWGVRGDDIHVKLTGPTEQANAIVKSVVPEQFHSFCNPALGTGNPGTFCVDVLTSPKLGTVLMFQVTDAAGIVSMRRTVILTDSTQGLLAWQNKKKWLKAAPVSLSCMFDVYGQWPNENGHRAGLKFGYGINSHQARGLKSKFSVTTAAVIHSIQEQMSSFVFDGDLCKIALTGGHCELDRESGAIRNLSCTWDKASIEVRSDEGLVAAELARIEKETKDWKNECQPGREWPALASMILEDVRASESILKDFQTGQENINDTKSSGAGNSDALVLLLDLLSDEAVLSRWSMAIAQLKERHSFHIPQENPSTGTGSGWIGFMPMVVQFVPVGTFPHRMGLIISEANSTGDSQLARLLLSDLLNNEDHGAIYCDLVARMFPGTELGAKFSKAGLERLSATAFQKDIAPFVGEPGVIREVLCSLLVWLQQTDDEEADRIAQLVAQAIRDQNGSAADIRPLLALIRSQRETAPEDVLTLLVPIVWEAGLRSWVEADLKSLAVPEDASKYFHSASLQIIQQGSGQAKKTDLPRKKPIKETSRAGRLEPIKLDEKWDLDKD